MWALSSFLLLSELAYPHLCTLWRKGDARSSAGVFQRRGDQHSQTISLPVPQTVLITRTQHLNDRLYLSKHVIFSQQSWIQLSGVSVSHLLPRLTCKCFLYLLKRLEKKFRAIAFKFSLDKAKPISSQTLDNVPKFSLREKSLSESRSVHKFESHKGSLFKQTKQSCIYKVT